MAVRAQVVGPRGLHLTDCREDHLGAQLPVMRLAAASARNLPLVGSRDGELQQLVQRGCPGLMHGRAHGQLQSFHIPTPRLAAGVENDAQQLVYFARDFSLDRGGRFFSWVVDKVASTGRNAQICSFTSNS